MTYLRRIDGDECDDLCRCSRRRFDGEITVEHVTTILLTIALQDCAGVYGGDAVEDNCGTCDNDPATIALKIVQVFTAETQ